MNLKERHTERVKRIQEERSEIKELLICLPLFMITSFAIVWLLSALAMIS